MHPPLRLEGCAGAIEDFTVAVEQAPYFADGWKRRGQARSALGEHTEALEVVPPPLLYVNQSDCVNYQCVSMAILVHTFRHKVGSLLQKLMRS